MSSYSRYYVLTPRFFHRLTAYFSKVHRQQQQQQNEQYKKNTGSFYKLRETAEQTSTQAPTAVTMNSSVDEGDRKNRRRRYRPAKQTQTENKVVDVRGTQTNLDQSQFYEDLYESDPGVEIKRKKKKTKDFMMDTVEGRLPHATSTPKRKKEDKENEREEEEEEAAEAEEVSGSTQTDYALEEFMREKACKESGQEDVRNIVPRNSCSIPNMRAYDDRSTGAVLYVDVDDAKQQLYEKEKEVPRTPLKQLNKQPQKPQQKQQQQLDFLWKQWRSPTL